MATKIPGYHGQLLEIDLTARTHKVVDLDPKLARNYIGGRAMGGKMLMDAYGTNWGKVDPLSPDAQMLFLAAPFVCYIACKLNTVVKSPQSFGMVGSQGSGDFVHEMKFAGYDGIIFKGKASSPVYVTLLDDKVEIRDASKMWGKEITETHKMIIEEHGTETSQVYIGPAGENMVRYAGVLTEFYRACARGGPGAVMGSKNLKAIVAKGTGPAPDVADKAKMLELLASPCHQVQLVRNSSHEWGTTGGFLTTGNRQSSMPVRNWQSEWHEHSEMSVQNFAAEQWVRRYWADYGCTVACSKLGRIKYGKRAGTITELPDYEAALLTTNFGIFDINEASYSAARPDELGYDLISCGNVMGFAAECIEKGIFKKEDIGGIDLKWGDADGFIKLMELVAHRQGEIPTLLGEGLGPASKKLGKGAEDMVFVSKNIEWGAHGSRSGRDGNELSYSVGSQGGDHMSRASERGESAFFQDSNGMCSFQGLSMDQAIELINAITGFGLTTQEVNTKLIPMWTTMARVTLLAGGMSYKDDVNPGRAYQPLPEGPYKGNCVDKKVEQEKMQAYYAMQGWDKQGVPTAETLQKNDLAAFEGVMAPLRAKA
jgi:aldehyde:ferredoxin oxidoreductase